MNVLAGFRETVAQDPERPSRRRSGKALIKDQGWLRAGSAAYIGHGLTLVWRGSREAKPTFEVVLQVAWLDPVDRFDELDPVDRQCRVDPVDWQRRVVRVDRIHRIGDERVVVLVVPVAAVGPVGPE